MDYKLELEHQDELKRGVKSLKISFTPVAESLFLSLGTSLLILAKFCKIALFEEFIAKYQKFIAKILPKFSNPNEVYILKKFQTAIEDKGKKSIYYVILDEFNLLKPFPLKSLSKIIEAFCADILTQEIKILGHCDDVFNYFSKFFNIYIKLENLGFENNSKKFFEPNYDYAKIPKIRIKAEQLENIVSYSAIITHDVIFAIENYKFYSINSKAFSYNDPGYTINLFSQLNFSKTDEKSLNIESSIDIDHLNSIHYEKIQEIVKKVKEINEKNECLICQYSNQCPCHHNSNPSYAINLCEDCKQKFQRLISYYCISCNKKDNRAIITYSKCGHSIHLGCKKSIKKCICDSEL